MSARITRLRLTAFTSFHDVVVPLAPLTVLALGEATRAALGEEAERVAAARGQRLHAVTLP